MMIMKPTQFIWLLITAKPLRKGEQKFHYRVNKVKPAQSLSFQVFKIHFNIIPDYV
jgi:hypothetical protein